MTQRVVLSDGKLEQALAEKIALLDEKDAEIRHLRREIKRLQQFEYNADVVEQRIEEEKAKAEGWKKARASFAALLEKANLDLFSQRERIKLLEEEISSKTTEIDQFLAENGINLERLLDYENTVLRLSNDLERAQKRVASLTSLEEAVKAIKL